MTATMETREGVAVQVVMQVVVPSLNVDQAMVLKKLETAAFTRAGVTITMPDGDRVDVDLVGVQEVHP